MLNLKVIALVICTAILTLSQSSCLVVARKDNGLHKGHYKSPNHPKPSKSFSPGKSNGNPHGKPPGKFKR
jgi:hypothetical protein